MQDLGSLFGQEIWGTEAASGILVIEVPRCVAWSKSISESYPEAPQNT